MAPGKSAAAAAEARLPAEPTTHELILPEHGLDPRTPARRG
uniref:Uncharacterized protein n=1 Tax=Arundo donax TaxID=35708 RepID=A0A0A9HMG4_ARUDO